jgi:hypothetical protein
MTPGALAYAYLGYAGREAIGGSETLVKTGSIALALLAVVIFLPRLWRRFRRVRMVEPQQMHENLLEEQALVLDVRSTSEYLTDVGHIAGSRNVPLPELEGVLPTLSEWRDKPLYRTGPATCCDVRRERQSPETAAGKPPRSAARYRRSAT